MLSLLTLSTHSFYGNPEETKKLPAKEVAKEVIVPAVLEK